MVSVSINGHCLDVVPGTSIFDAATRMGVRIPTSCVAQGKCKECIVEIGAGMDLLAANQLARAFYSPVYASATPQQPANIARFQFLDAASHDFYPDWNTFADICVAILRTEAGRNPHDRELHDLIGELSTRSDAFRTRWGAHDVRHHSTGSKTFHHPVVGDITIAYEGLEMAAEPGLTLTIYTAEPGSPSEDALSLLASWAASQETEQDTESATRHQSG